jgi:hypothetical protein
VASGGGLLPAVNPAVSLSTKDGTEHKGLPGGFEGFNRLYGIFKPVKNFRIKIACCIEVFAV